MKKVLIFLLSFLFMASLSLDARTKLVSRSQKKKPAWITIPPQEKGLYYFVGISQNSATLDKAMRGAIEEALKQVLTVIGVFVGNKMQIDKQIEGDKTITKMLDEYKEVGKGKVSGHRIKEIYTEEYFDDEKKERFYDVYLLMKYSEAEIQKERDRIAREQAENRKTAQGYIDTAQKNVRELGLVWESYKNYCQAFALLADQPGSPVYNESLFGVKKVINGIKITEIARGKNIAVRVDVTMGEKDYPLGDLKLKAEIVRGTGTITASVFTDKTGEGKFSIAKLKFDEGIARVKIYPEEEQFLLPLENAYFSRSDMDNLKKTLEEKAFLLNLKSAEFGYSVSCVFIWDEKGRDKQVEDIISKELVNSGIKVVSIAGSLPAGITYGNFESDEFYQLLEKEGVQRAVLGEVGVIDQGQVYSLHSVKGSLRLKILDLKKREVMNTLEEGKAHTQLNFERAKSDVKEYLGKRMAPKITELLSL